MQIVPIIQSFAQLEKNYGKEGSEIIIDNTQLTIFGGFAPQSSSAEVLSKALGSRTVMSGSVSRSKNDPSQSLQMMERPLMTPDELKAMPKGQFIVMKTGFYPMKVRLKLFFKWGIQFDEKNPYSVIDQGNREVKYANKKDLIAAILLKYPPKLAKDEPIEADEGGAAQSEEMSEKNQPQNHQPDKRNEDKKKSGGQRNKNDKKGGVNIQPIPQARRHTAPEVTPNEPT